MRMTKAKWLWLFAVAPFVMAFLMETTYELSGRGDGLSGLLLVAFGLVTLVCVIGMFFLLITEKKHIPRPMAANAADQMPNETSGTEAASNRRKDAVVRAACIGGIVVLEIATRTLGLPNLLTGWLALGFIGVLAWSIFGDER